MEGLPPRFTVDNSLDARNLRMRQYAAARVVEIPHRHVLAEPEGYEDNVARVPKFALGPLNNVVEVNFRPEDPPVQAA